MMMMSISMMIFNSMTWSIIMKMQEELFRGYTTLIIRNNITYTDKECITNKYEDAVLM